MADFRALARSARYKLQRGDATCMAHAIRKAIQGVGISYEADVRRLMRAVGSTIAQEDRAERIRHATKQRRSG